MHPTSGSANHAFSMLECAIHAFSMRGHTMAHAYIMLQQAISQMLPKVVL